MLGCFWIEEYMIEADFGLFTVVAVRKHHHHHHHQQQQSKPFGDQYLCVSRWHHRSELWSCVKVEVAVLGTRP